MDKRKKPASAARRAAVRLLTPGVARQPAATDPVAPDHLLAAALASMASAIFITDANGIILWVNDAFTRLSGYAALEAVGSTPAILSSGRQDRRYYGLLWETILAGKVWQGEVIDRHKTGSLYVVDEIITPLFDQLGVVSHFIAIQHDITERSQESERDHYAMAGPCARPGES